MEVGVSGGAKSLIMNALKALDPMVLRGVLSVGLSKLLVGHIL